MGGVATALALSGLLLAGCAITGSSAEEDPVAADRSPESVGLSSEALGRLDRVLEGYVDRGQLPGYQLLIARHGRIVHESVYGKMDLESDRELRPDTIHRIYSMSKVITGAATMIAWERGRFLLNDPIGKHLPALADLGVMEWDENGDTRIVPAKREITVLDLLRHTSGISYSFIARPPLGPRYVEASLTPGLRPLPVPTALGPSGKDTQATLEDMVERLGELPLAIQPGSAWHYGINMDVLGRLIEVSSGQGFPEFLEDQLFAPLGMKDTAFYVPDEKIDRFATLYRPPSERPPSERPPSERAPSEPEPALELVDAPYTSSYREPPAMPGGGGGLVGTARDYMRFALMLLGGGALDGRRVLGPRTVELMMSNHLPQVDFGDRPLVFATGDAYANGGLGVGFGLSGSVITQPAFTGLPVSAGTFGWGGAASTFFWVDPEEDIAVVFMTQLLASNAYPLRAHLMKGVNAAILE